MSAVDRIYEFTLDDGSKRRLRMGIHIDEFKSVAPIYRTESLRYYGYTKTKGRAKFAVKTHADQFEAESLTVEIDPLFRLPVLSSIQGW